MRLGRGRFVDGEALLALIIEEGNWLAAHLA
jgi:hypothetical protein